MVSMDTLNSEQREKIAQYQTITQVQDFEQVFGQMIEHEWNLERAIQSVYENNTQEKREELEQEVANSTKIYRNTRPFMHTPKKRPFLMSLLFWPFGIAWNLTWSILTLASRLFLSRQTITNKKPRDPRVLAVEFIEKFELKYGSKHVDFFKGSYAQALEKARKDLRFLLVMLQSDDHDDTHLFNRQTLNSTRFMEFIKDNNILVWAGNVHESEGHKVSYTLKATTYPFMALIALQSTDSSTPKMSVIERMEGPYHVEELVSQIQISIDRDGSLMKRMFHEREQREYERQLRVDQDAAYKESLRADQEKARKQQEEQDKQRQLELEKESEKQKREQFIQYLLYELEQEPTDKDVAKLSFRLADGDRVIRQFSSEATLDTLYRFVQVYPLLKEKVPATKVDRPEGYVHQYQFTIHSPYPRIEFEADETKKIKDIKSLWPSATLVVDAIDDDEEEE